MLIGYLILAGVAITDWLLQGAEKRSGRIVVWALFLAGIVVNISFIFSIDALVQVATVLEVAAIITFLVRLWPRIKPAVWSGTGADFARTSVVFLAVGIGVLGFGLVFLYYWMIALGIIMLVWATTMLSLQYGMPKEKH